MKRCNSITSNTITAFHLYESYVNCEILLNQVPEFLPWPWSTTSRKEKVEAFRKKRAEERKKAEEVRGNG
jgi:hypothetical protein